MSGCPESNSSRTTTTPGDLCGGASLIGGENRHVRRVAFPMHPPFRGPFFLPTPTSFSPAPAPCFPIQISGQQLLPQSSSDSLCFLASFFICFHCKCHGTFRSGGVGEARTCRRDVMMIATPQLTGDGERPCCCPLFRTGAERPAEPPPDPVGHPGKKSVVATAGAAACRWMHGRCMISALAHCSYFL